MIKRRIKLNKKNVGKVKSMKSHDGGQPFPNPQPPRYGGKGPISTPSTESDTIEKEEQAIGSFYNNFINIRN